MNDFKGGVAKPRVLRRVLLLMQCKSLLKLLKKFKFVLFVFCCIALYSYFICIYSTFLCPASGCQNDSPTWLSTTCRVAIQQSTESSIWQSCRFKFRFGSYRLCLAIATNAHNMHTLLATFGWLAFCWILWPMSIKHHFHGCQKRRWYVLRLLSGAISSTWLYLYLFDWHLHFWGFWHISQPMLCMPCIFRTETGI